jgi:hypothetical protein
MMKCQQTSKAPKKIKHPNLLQTSFLLVQNNYMCFCINRISLLYSQIIYYNVQLSAKYNRPQ